MATRGGVGRSISRERHLGRAPSVVTIRANSDRRGLESPWFAPIANRLCAAREEAEAPFANDRDGIGQRAPAKLCGK